MFKDPNKPFISRYQTYKTLTEEFAAGLHLLAKQSGYELDEVRSKDDVTSNIAVNAASRSDVAEPLARSNPAPSSTRLKGKARKLAKAQEQKSKPKPPTTTVPNSNRAKPSIILKTADFIRLAKHIVQAAKVKVPAGFLSLLQKTIRLRKAFSKKFANLFQATTSKTVDGHQHFVNVLEEVHRTLLEAHKTSKTSAKRSQRQTFSASPDDATNMFATLTLHESQEDEKVAETEAQELSDILAATTHTVFIEIEDDPDDTEALFALFCMAEDLHEIRDYLSSLWHMYAASSMSLTTASVVTNTAIELSSQVVGEFLTRFPRFQSYVQVQRLMAEKFAKISEKASDTSSCTLPHRVSDFLFLNTLLIFEKLLPVVQKQTLPVYNGALGEYPIGSGPLSRSEKEYNDMLLILEMFPHFCALGLVERPLFGIDELSKTFIEFYRNKNITVALVFGTQILLDIHDALEGVVQKSLKDCESVGQQSLELTRYIRSTPSMFSNPQNMAVLSQSEGFVNECVLGDIVCMTMQKSVPQHILAKCVGSTVAPRYLLKHHPLLCGTMMFSLQIQNHELMETFLMATGYVIQSTHLINLLQKNKYTSLRWPVLDEYIKVYSSECLFAGPAPVKPEDCLKRLYLILGGHVSKFASNTRSLNQPRRAGKDWTKRRSTLLDAFFTKYVEGKALAWTKESVDRLILETYGESVEIEVEESKFSYTPYGLSIMQTLQSIHFLLDHDNTLRLDLFKLQRACTDLLTLLHQRLETRLLKYTEGTRYAEDATQIPFVANAIMMVAAGSAKTGQQLGLSRGSVVYSKVLVDVAEIFDEFTRSRDLNR